jgi:pyruvate dehydrogenase E1 component
VQLLGSGAILREVLAAAEMLEQDWGVRRPVERDRFTELARDGNAVTRWNTLHPTDRAAPQHVERASRARRGR